MPTALVTGASHGLGERYARELAQRGYAVVLVDRDASALAAAAERVGRATGAIVETIVADLLDDRHVARVERRVVAGDLPIEMLVNNAGSFDHAPAGDPDGRYLAALERLTRAAAGVMTARGRGGIVAVSGAAGSPGVRVPEVADAIAGTLRGTGARITAVVPGRAGSRWGDHDGLDGVVRRSFSDLDRGRTVSEPGRVHRAVTGSRETPRAVLRLAALVRDRARRRPGPGSLPGNPRRLVRAPGSAVERVPAGARPTSDVGGGAGHTRPSPVPGPFRDAPASAPTAAVTTLPAQPPRPVHVPADDVPHPRRGPASRGRTRA